MLEINVLVVSSVTLSRLFNTAHIQVWKQAPENGRGPSRNAADRLQTVFFVFLTPSADGLFSRR